MVILDAQRKADQELDPATRTPTDIKHSEEMEIGLGSFIAARVEAEMFLRYNCGFVPTWEWGLKMGMCQNASTLR